MDDYKTTRPDCALIVGHTRKAPGAVSVGGVSEYDFNSKLALDVVTEVERMTFDKAKKQSVVTRLVYRDEPNDYWGLPKKVNATGARFAISLHFNAARSKHATGTEVLYWHRSLQGRALATMLLDELLHALDLPQRGIKGRTIAGRGGRLLAKTAMPCVIAEPFFGSNVIDWNTATANRDRLVEAYARCIVNAAEGLGKKSAHKYR